MTMKLKNFNNRIAIVPEETKKRVHLSMNILDRIHELLQVKFDGKQKDLALALGISEAAVSKMINGLQNFNISTLSKLEVAFNAQIIAVCTDSLEENFVTTRTKSAITKTIKVIDGGDFQDDNYIDTPNTKSLINL